MIRSVDEYLDRFPIVYQGLVENGSIKAVLAAFLMVGLVVIEAVTGLFVSDPELIAAVLILLTLDFITGTGRAVLEGGWKSITSYGMRGTGVKFIEYFFILTGITIISNMHDTLYFIRLWGFIFVALTEFWSIGENFYSMRVRNFLSSFAEVLKSKAGIDGEFGKRPTDERSKKS